MNETTKKAIKSMLGRPYLLAGNGWKYARQLIVTDLTGTKTPLAKSGITVLEKLLIKEARIDTDGKCYAEIEKELEAWSKTL